MNLHLLVVHALLSPLIRNIDLTISLESLCPECFQSYFSDSDVVADKRLWHINGAAGDQKAVLEPIVKDLIFVFAKNKAPIRFLLVYIVSA